jgi:hypothetical protein
MRIEPALPVTAMKTYGIKVPLTERYFRPATCAEADCSYYLHGWESPIDESTEQGQEQAWYIRNRSGRRFTEDRDQKPGLTVFKFEAGQQCFADKRRGAIANMDPGRHHAVRVGRPELFIVRGGDWRGHTGESRQHANADDWVDDFANHQLRLADQIEKG